MITFLLRLPTNRPDDRYPVRYAGGVAVVTLTELLDGPKTLEDIWDCQLIHVSRIRDYEKLKLHFPELPVLSLKADGRTFPGEEESSYFNYYIPQPWASLIAMNFPLSHFQP